MNLITQVETTYLRSSRTIEKLELFDNNKKMICYIYNYEGNHYRFFESQNSLEAFFKYGNEPKLSFENEFDLDTYLLKKKIEA